LLFDITMSMYLATFSGASSEFTNINVTITRTAEDTVLSVFPNGISISVSVSGGIPTAVASLPGDFQNLTEGLQGNYNGDDTDDFIFRNGTMLSNDANERMIFEFGQSCKSLLSATAQECHVAKICNTKLTMII